jgi:hypothetical protein
VRRGHVFGQVAVVQLGLELEGDQLVRERHSPGLDLQVLV